MCSVSFSLEVHLLSVTRHASRRPMRLRIQTLPPLPDLKVWFVPRPTSAALSLNTIVELKRALCHDIKHLQSQGIQPYDIRLLLDEFELLGDLPYHEVLRDGDLVCVQVLQEPRSNIEVSRKRRAVEDVESALVLVQPWSSCSNVL
jgi:hypothetical protein